MLSAPLRARALLQRTITTRLPHQAIGFQQLRLSRPTSIVAAPGVALPAASTTTKRSMASSTAAAPLQEWLVIAPDFKGALEKRLSVREQHLSELKEDDDSFWLWGGAMLEEPLVEGAAPKMSGSCMLIGAKTREEVVERLKRDKYVLNEVWDWEKVQIIPFKSALRKPL